MGDRKRPLTPEQWAQVRAAYESGESEAALSRRFGADRKTIRARRRAEAWVPHPVPQVGKAEAEHIRDVAQAKVIDIATRRAVDQVVSDGTVDDVADVIRRTLVMQGQLFNKAGELIDKTLDRALTGQLKLGKVQGETTAVADLLSSISRFARDTRVANGLRDGTPTVGLDDADEGRVDNVVLTVSRLEPKAESA